MLKNPSVTTFTVFELLRENQLGTGGGGKIYPPPRLGLISSYLGVTLSSWNIKENFRFT